MFKSYPQGLWIAVAFILSTSGCAQMDKKAADTNQAQLGSIETTGILATPKEIPSFHLSDPAPPKVVDVELEQIPTEINPLVDKWVDYFQGRGRKHMERYLSRSTRYSELMKRILRQNGLPEDLIYIALIESGFSSRATSRAAAVGYWQFIRGTGRRYGLEINSMIDERRDPILSTQAAAEYFKGLYSVFGSWYLSMASYNVGENRVKREVMNHYTRDFWELARKRRFPKETINYVPKFIAAKLIASNPAKYGFTEVEYEKPIEFELIKVDKPLNLRIMAEKMGMEYTELKQLNPKFRGEIAPPKAYGLEIRVPAGTTQVAMNAARDSVVAKIEFVADAGETQTYRVRPGDSLYTIARRYRTTVGWLKDTNDIGKGRRLRVGMRIQVPERTSAKKSSERIVAKSKSKPEPKIEDKEKASTTIEVAGKDGIYYIVQPGDTLSAIADEYDSTISEIRRMNRLSRGAVLRAGMKIKVPKEDEGLPQDIGGGVRQAINDSANVNGNSVMEVGSGIRHTVRRGENLATIAKKYGVSIQSIREANNLNKRAMIKVGVQLLIPSSKSAPNSVNSGSKYSNKKIVVAKNTKQKNKVNKKVHVVRRGDNLTQIASRYAVTVQDLIIRNGLEKANRIAVGARLFIPDASARE